MIHSATLLMLTCLSLQLSAQTYSCETSRVGKLVTKPLVKNETIHYEDLVTDKNDMRHSSADFTSMKKDSAGNTCIARHHALDKERTIDLLFVSNKKTGKCTYQITLISTKEVPHGIRLDEDGGATDWDENTPLTYDMKKEEQKLVDQWIRYFE